MRLLQRCQRCWKIALDAVQILRFGHQRPGFIRGQALGGFHGMAHRRAPCLGVVVTHPYGHAVQPRQQGPGLRELRVQLDRHLGPGLGLDEVLLRVICHVFERPGLEVGLVRGDAGGW